MKWSTEGRLTFEFPKGSVVSKYDKVWDSLAGLVAARSNANDPQERTIARKALAKNELHMVLHLKQPTETFEALPACHRSLQSPHQNQPLWTESP